ncbi:hypothetical protein D4R87_01380 [bacterium]|nr:MAG: hypothetical protein D4R87_01380 [bacterium]
MTRDIHNSVAKLKREFMDKKIKKNEIKNSFSSEIEKIEKNVLKISKKTGFGRTQVIEIIAEILDKGKGGSLCVMMML